MSAEDEKNKPSQNPDLHFKEFERDSKLADTGFVAQSWPAWFVMPTEKLIAPISRLYIGSVDGETLFKRNVALGGLLDLAAEILNSASVQVDMLNDMNDFGIFVPEEKTEMLDLIGNLKKKVDKIEEGIQKLEFGELGKQDAKSDN